ncbi:MAG TPA: RICIN domain-containing protein [Streptosporangiaceae bacterium]|nr:RICIN domain-containing protein [Streptosporangiaceae bacterium]
MKIRLTIAAAALGVAAATMLGLATALPAGAATTVSTRASLSADSDNAFGGEFVNFNSGDCLGILGGADDAPAVQWPCDGSANQGWTFGSEYGDDSGYYQLVNGDGQCLGVLGGSTGEGAPVYGWTCLGPTHPDQYWRKVQSGIVPGYHYLENLNSGLVVGVSGNSTAEGASVVQWADQDTANNQLWEPM